MFLRTAGVLIELIWSHPANHGRRVRTLAKSFAWQLYKRSIARPFNIRAFGGKFRCYSDSHEASRMIYFNGTPDSHEMVFVRRYLRPGDKVIDAGANVGIYTLFMASLVGAKGRILAFEPDPKTADRLRENIALNRLANVTAKQAALSNFIGTADFTQGADSGNALYSVRTYDRPPQQVQVTTLGSEIGDESYALCKMDVEGAEWDVLKGTEQSLSRNNPPVWLIELSEKMQAKTGHSVADIEAWLKDRGYALWRYNPEANQLERFVSLPRKPGKVGDAVAIASVQLGMVKARLGIE